MCWCSQDVNSQISTDLSGPALEPVPRADVQVNSQWLSRVCFCTDLYITMFIVIQVDLVSLDFQCESSTQLSSGAQSATSLDEVQCARYSYLSNKLDQISFHVPFSLSSTLWIFRQGLWLIYPVEMIWRCRVMRRVRRLISQW